ncbi:AraC family transcriptional regulator [Anaeromyxobacter sp. Fw109-5]|uniref:AraC family transcriptional regulator n=1 Tax=Anaeromyxobacter sp. (strain Fw109-5) TaxID=404589 RepID=UPI0000ED73FA|nr:AraC family transcriptional regulator [Anaeromyxobacter sp. Fw109-5]ABS26757.1 AraC-type transcriptional regulator domain protein [Anaeromyxobacter sp. Fw109-5]
MPRRSRSENSLAAGIAGLAHQEGCSRTRHPGVVVWRMTDAHPPTPTLYAASLILVGSGEKQATLGEQTFAYNADHLLVVTSPLPMLCRTIASETEPVLTLVVEIEMPLLRELILEAPASSPPRWPASTRTVFRMALSPELEDAGARLLRHLGDDRRTKVLGRQTIREMLFLVLESSCGDSLRAVAEGTVSRFSHVLRHMNGNFAGRMKVEELARLAHTSVPTFHQRFKAMTGTSPLQYMKTLRLTRARQLLREGAMVKAVAHDVGYESESQFSREYRRLFGGPPSSDSYLSPAERSY